MNEKGIYSAVIGIAAIAIVAAAYFSAVSVESVKGSLLGEQAIREAKSDWLNAMFLVDKALAIAMVEATNDKFQADPLNLCAGCENPSVQAKALENIDAAIAELRKNSNNCSIAAGQEVNALSPNVSASIKLKCEKSFGGFKAVFEKSVQVDKEARTQIVSASPTTKNCVIDIVDKKGSQAQPFEVSRTVSKTISAPAQ